ncbi:phosphoribosylglycinamide formyltransferase [Nonomuraea glycinis]|uniref:Phosphoribosylglycinamide formyltransferase n=1 Tax=Nonomuraea glycinis TaxID=2047744 RepID=A0A918A8Q2_9ACTN|nr:phosphoribosylglycinamide formyltransferase [Nonomuraea glycinis]MCA2179852.1 phosphoribosylglycinamide formyltransferase [Nonomuraea glycinis]WSG71571.1 phosphoribosylglycinamide formyltransferase [Nonomuraea glycinis]GGP10374.1 phosphoribosylglycinamide formyltransferase [Nonomuraea glycinis]
MSKAGRLVVLVSGSGTNLQALLDASADPSYGAQVVAVGADREGIEGLARASRSGVPTFVHKLGDYPSRQEWDAAIAEEIASYKPDLVVSAGFMKILGAPTLDAVPVLNTHPALLPSFPGAHGVRDALAHGVKVTGCTVMLADAGVDTGPIVAQEAVPVLPDDDEAELHERIKTVERRLLVDIVGRLAREGWTVSGRIVRIGNPSGGESK